MSGHRVVEVKDNKLVRTFPDGKQEFIKNIKPGIPVKVGQKIQLKAK
jgi:hypothetical protein